MHILVTNDDGPPSNKSSPYIHSFVQTLQSAGHTVSVILPHQQRSWIGKAHFVGQVTKPTYFRPGTLHEDDGTTHARPFTLPSSSSSSPSKTSSSLESQEKDKESEKEKEKDQDQEEWILLNNTPATCAQLGLYHFFRHLPPIDLVVSGPNYGRNSTALFSLSSGTIGGAMEAATCRHRAIALSYAFYSREHDPALIAGASRHSVRLVEYLYANWGRDVDLYSVNVPLVEGVGGHKVMYTHALQNYWESGSSSFTEIEAEEGEAEEDADHPHEREREMRKKGDLEKEPGVRKETSHRHRHRNFKWTPKFTDIAKSIEHSPPGNDGWAIGQGYTSVTPLKASFMHATSVQMGELKLSSPPPTTTTTTITSITPPTPKHPPINILLPSPSDSPYLTSLLIRALKLHLSPLIHPHTLIYAPLSPISPSASPCLYLTPYDTLSASFPLILSNPTTHLSSSYIIRKALIRKHHLAITVGDWMVKYPESGLGGFVPRTVGFELDYAEFLEEAMRECGEGGWWGGLAREEDGDSASNDEGKEKMRDREWWVLKPGMSDGGKGVRLFCSQEGLRGIFEGWEAEEEEEGEEEERNEREEEYASPENVADTSDGELSLSEPPKSASYFSNSGIVTSQLRHFVAQRYIDPPLLFATHGNRKFHIRSYVLAVGALRVYVQKEMLALFAPEAYRAPYSSGQGGGEKEREGLDPRIHLTNSCLQDGSREGTVIPFWDLPSVPRLEDISSSSSSTSSEAHHEDWKTRVFAQVAETTGTLFLAAARGQMVHFQTLPNAFEVFGIDWLVNASGKVWLLEVNAGPDFKQSGDEGRGVVERLWEGVLGIVLRGDGGSGIGGKGFFDGDRVNGDGNRGDGNGEVGREMWGMRKVLDVDLGRR